jgi:hypothetical protein
VDVEMVFKVARVELHYIILQLISLKSKTRTDHLISVRLEMAINKPEGRVLAVGFIKIQDYAFALGRRVE